MGSSGQWDGNWDNYFIGGAVQRNDLGCEVVALRYDFVQQVGELVMQRGHCCDMTACIELFKRIDPGVKGVRTFAGSEPDTEYWIVEGRWRARVWGDWIAEV